MAQMAMLSGQGNQVIIGQKKPSFFWDFGIHVIICNIVSPFHFCVIKIASEIAQAR